jgi:uroporphyrinogen-III synthase
MDEAVGSLAGKRVVNTRAAHQAGELDELLCARRAQPLPYPCIRIAPPEDPTTLDEALREAARGGFDWLLLTSANGVHAIAGRLTALDIGPLPAELRLGAIGSGTAHAAERELGRVPDLLPDEALAEGLLAAFPRRPGLRVLLPQGDLARPLLARGLQEQNVAVAAVPAYRTLVGTGGVDLPALLVQRRVDALALTSPSAARNLMVRLGEDQACLKALGDLRAACIGPVTAAAAADLGLPVLQAVEHSLVGLVDELETYFSTVVVRDE